LYGTPESNSLTLLRKYFEKYPEDAAKVQLNIKGCTAVGKMEPDGSKEGVFRDVQRAIQQLPPHIKKIDMFEPARVDKSVPLEETMMALKECQDKGWIGGVALSEASGVTIRNASRFVKILAVEYELGLFTTNALTNGVAHACSELDIPIHAYGTFCHGLLTQDIKSFDDLDKDDFRRVLPRFQGENLEANLKLVNAVRKLAEKNGCTPGQVATGWALALSKSEGLPKIIPIPGASKADRVRENGKVIEMTPVDMKEIDQLLSQCEVKGNRYPDFTTQYLDE
ncbi:Aldo/keto reductase, partial [Microthyrium microscopicum]